ncbi:MAG: hypothetical protein ACM30E_11400 [Nitrososphaerales archaeon]
MELDDFLDAFNWIDRITGLVSSVIHLDTKAAAAGPPLVGLAFEVARSASGAGAWSFYLRRSAGWTGGDVERLLQHYAIPVWGRRVTGQHYVLSVPRRQANWAEYLILRRGMPLEGPLLNLDNRRHAEKYAPGDQPPAWADRGREPQEIAGPVHENGVQDEPRGLVDHLSELL